MAVEIDFDKMQGLGAGHCAGRVHGRGADAGLHEPRSLRQNARHRLRHVLQPHPQRVVDQRRDLRQPVAGGHRAGRLRPRHDLVPRRRRGQRRGLPHRHADLLQHRTACHWREVRDEAAAGNSQGKPAGGDAGAAGAGRIAGVCESAIVLCGHQRSGNRVHVDSGAGDGALRGARRPRRGHDRASTG